MRGRTALNAIADALQWHYQRAGGRVGFLESRMLARDWLRANEWPCLDAAQASRIAVGIMCNWLACPEDVQ